MIFVDAPINTNRHKSPFAPFTGASRSKSAVLTYADEAAGVVDLLSNFERILSSKGMDRGLIAAMFILVNVQLTMATGLFIAVCIGLAAGAELDLLVYFTSKYFGPRHYPAIFGGIFAVFSIGAGVAPPAQMGLHMQALCLASCQRTAGSYFFWTVRGCIKVCSAMSNPSNSPTKQDHLRGHTFPTDYFCIR